jgi:hypothetical protein
MSRKMKMFLAALAWIAFPAFASAPSAPSARQALIERLPGSLESVREIAFCPDNTCILVRTQDSTVELEGWALAYLFHFASYYALADWRADIGSPDNIQGYPQPIRDCFAQADAMTCSRTAFERAGVSVLFVRYDEGVRAEGDAGFMPIASGTGKD